MSEETPVLDASHILSGVVVHGVLRGAKEHQNRLGGRGVSERLGKFMTLLLAQFWVLGHA